MKVNIPRNTQDVSNSVAGSLSVDREIESGNSTIQASEAFNSRDDRGAALQRMADDYSRKQAVFQPTTHTNRVPTRLPAVPVLKPIQSDSAVMQLVQVPSTGAKKKKKQKSKQSKKATPSDSQTKRYPGHDSDANKRALYEIMEYRNNTLTNAQLSHPEETALANSSPGNIQTGKQNITTKMHQGTAICHKISDKSIRNEIEELFSDEKKPKTIIH